MNKTILIATLVVVIIGVVALVGWKMAKTTPQQPIPDKAMVSPTPITGKGCKRGGCSNQLCLDASAPEVVSTCEYREEYGCYQKAECRQQENGECNFTLTPELTNCLMNGDLKQTNGSFAR